MIQVIQSQNLPQYRFEWHPETKKVWFMQVPDENGAPGKVVDAYVLAEHCDNHAQAFGLVQTWCRGYREGQKNPMRETVK